MAQALNPRAVSDLLSAIDTVSKKRRMDPSIKKIDELLSILEGWEERSARCGSNDETRMAEFSSMSKEIQTHDAKDAIASHHKEVLAAATKLSKVADKVIPVVDAAVPSCSFDIMRVHEAIHLHLLVAGRFEAARTFREEAGLVERPELVDELREMHAACTELEARRTDLVASWIERHAHELGEGVCMLKLEVLHLRFIQRLLTGDTAGALTILRSFTATELPSLQADRSQVAQGSFWGTLPSDSPESQGVDEVRTTNVCCGGSGSPSTSAMSAAPTTTLREARPVSRLQLAVENRVRTLMCALAFGTPCTRSVMALRSSYSG
mmetsp:Transcript_30635/g.79555  ORF Transcript_30635/g.79555 Transcript_30635/m.79555 type:complete len:323 (-) Transcript_30635:800-1768(-)